MKLYFIIGLPTEEDDRRRRHRQGRKNALGVGKRMGKQPRVTVSVSTHVPKPHTPFQWAALDPASEDRPQAGDSAAEGARHREGSSSARTTRPRPSSRASSRAAIGARRRDRLRVPRGARSIRGKTSSPSSGAPDSPRSAPASRSRSSSARSLSGARRGITFSTSVSRRPPPRASSRTAALATSLEPPWRQSGRKPHPPTTTMESERKPTSAGSACHDCAAARSRSRPDAERAQRSASRALARRNPLDSARACPCSSSANAMIGPSPRSPASPG